MEREPDRKRNELDKRKQAARLLYTGMDVEWIAAQQMLIGKRRKDGDR